VLPVAEVQEAAHHAIEVLHGAPEGEARMITREHLKEALQLIVMSAFAMWLAWVVLK
jgi:hypothetical protein